MKQEAAAQLESELRRKIKGDVLFDRMSRLIYATDASLYQMIPMGVVLPKDKEDLIQAVRTAARDRVPILPRGGGTSLAGQAVSPGLVIDCSKHLNRIIEIDTNQRWVRVEPGIVLDELNQSLQPTGLFFSPDPATSSRANIGGMIGNNSSGTRSIRYGKTIDKILDVGVLLSTGEEIRFGPLDRAGLDQKCRQNDREGEIYRKVRQLVRDNRDEIKRRYPKVMRRVSGYNLDALLDEENFNLASLMVGSEGTLGVVTEARFQLDPIPAARAVAVIHFNDLFDAIRTVQELLTFNPSAVEILDRYGLDLGRTNPAVASLCSTFLKGAPEAVLIVEFSEDSEERVRERMASLEASSLVRDRAYHVHKAWSIEEQNTVWQVRKSTLGVLQSTKGDAKPLPFIEDSCVPVEVLGDYIARVMEICSKHGRQMALYAHASVGVIHVRPVLNLKKQEDVEIMQSISHEVFEEVKKFGGSWSGEHGDGRARSYKLKEFFGERIYEVLKEIKRLFDPLNVMNPGNIIDAPPMTDNLRIHPDYKVAFPTTHYRFGVEQGFDRAIEMCTGVGQCRKTLTGTMCPSYMVTRDEEHSTRGRANALRMAISGQFGPEGFTSHRLYDVLDLCLECKACKSECPSNVDMAKLKAEFLAHYYDHHRMPLGKRLMANARRTAEISSRVPRLANLATQNYLSRLVLEKVAGIDRRRKLPSYAPKTLAAWFKKRKPRPVGPSSPVVALFADTFTNFYEPQIGQAATHVLEAAGFRVVLAEGGCCGRPLLSSGLLQQGKQAGSDLMRRLHTFTGQDIPVVVLEPSCFATLLDDHMDLLDEQELCQEVMERVMTLEQFLGQPDSRDRLRQILQPAPSRVLLHGHCQQKALIGTAATRSVLAEIPGSQTTEIDAGCCGMAGSFGYQAGHYEISQRIGERRLLPAVRKLEEGAVACAAGFSCRSQIEHFTGRTALHPAQVLASCLKRT